MRKIIIVAALLAASPTWATGSRTPDAEAEARAHADAAAEAQANVEINIGGGAEGEAGPLATAAGGAATAQGGNVTINQNREAQGDYEVKFRNNPNVYSAPPMPTISCYKTGGGGISGGGVGLSLGGGKIDPYCVQREEIRLAAAIGMTTQARFAWCNLENNIRLFNSVRECLAADTAVVSAEYQLLLERTERLERELRETQTVLTRRCQEAEERADRVEEAWLECQAK